MAGSGFELVPLNMPEVEAAFEKASRRTSTRTLMFALREAAKPVQKAWKARARRRRLGRVPRSIRRRAGRRTKHEVTYIIRSTQAGFMGYEYGTSKQPPRPAARPALDETRDQAIGIVRDILQQVVEAERAIPDVTEGQEEN